MKIIYLPSRKEAAKMNYDELRCLFARKRYGIDLATETDYSVKITFKIIDGRYYILNEEILENDICKPEGGK